MSATPPATYAHADLDAFFLSVEAALDPSLLRRPAAVVGGGRTVVLSASYAARAAGVHAGMPVAMALRSCPQLQTVPARIEAYRRAGRAVFASMAELGGQVSPVSIDEVSWDITDCCAPAGAKDAAALARAAREHVRLQFGLPLTIGVASSRLTAKVACDAAKPDGLLVVPADQQAAFLAPMPVSALPGIGPVTGDRLVAVGIRTLGELAAASPAALGAVLGVAHATQLVDAARGLDTAPAAQRGHSLGAERSYPDPLRGAAASQALEAVLVEALQRLAAAERAARSVTVIAGSPGEPPRTKTIGLHAPVRDVDTLAAAARTAASTLLHGRSVTHLGVVLSGLARDHQPVLDLRFTQPALVVPDAPTPSLAATVFAGMHVQHASFGPGLVVGRQGTSLAVRFPDRIRILDAEQPGALTFADE